MNAWAYLLLGYLATNVVIRICMIGKEMTVTLTAAGALFALALLGVAWMAVAGS